LAKAQSIHGSSQPDWRKVLETSELMLRHQSKDLRSAVWLTWALHQCESYTGLLAGLGLLRYLCEHHWSEVYPEKLRTRGAAFAWLVLRLEPLFTQGLPLQSQQPLFRAVLEQLVCLDEVWTKHLGDEAPLLLPIRRQLAQRLELAVQGDVPAAGITALRGPAPDKLKRYQERFAQGHYADLILELETSLAGAMFWFDGLHMLWQCVYKPASTSWRRSSSNIWTTNCNTQVLNIGSRNWPFR
jgi:predicted component of type VI protein secretion system